ARLTSRLGRRGLPAALPTSARCSPSTVLLLPSCIVSFQLTLMLSVFLPTVREPVQRPGWFYRATPCMGRRFPAAVRATARCSLSTRTARVLRICTVSRQLTLILSVSLPTVTELARLAD